MIVRPATDADMDQVAAIWEPILRDTTITFASDIRTAATLIRIAAERRNEGREFFVAEADGVILGFATYGQFRGGNGYATSMEHTVILAPFAQGRGVGRALMLAIEDHARDRGAHTMVAVVSGENPSGVAFHKAVGYVNHGTLPQVGRKFGRYLDAVFLVKIL